MRRGAFIGGLGGTFLCGTAGMPAHAQALPTVRVVTSTFDGGAQPFYGREMGFFRKAGLNAEITTLSNGAAMVTAVVAGAADIAQANVISVAAAHEKGIPLIAFAPAAMYFSTLPQTALVVVNASPIHKAADFAGKTVAVPGVRTIADIGVEAWLDKNGGSSATAQFVEIPNSAIAEALRSGRVAAGVITEPDLDQLVGKDFRIVGYPFDGIAKRFTLGAWTTTIAWAQAHPGLVQKFAAVMKESARWANSHHAESGKILEAVTNVPASMANRVTYGESLDAKDLQPMIDVAARYKVLRAAFPASELIYSGK